VPRFPSPFDIAVIDRLLLTRPLVFADVGAAGDVDALLRRYNDPKRVSYFAFEPNPEEFDRLPKRANARYLRYAISDRDGEAEFFIDGTASSLVPQRGGASIKTPVRSLGSLYEDGTLPALDAVKVDAEGHDLLALRGIGARLATDVLMVKTEFSFRPHLPGSYFAEIDKLLTASGLVLFGMQYNCSPVGEFNSGDALYLRSVESIVDGDAPPDVKRDRALRLIALCHYVHNLDYAYVIARTARDRGILSNEDAASIEAACRRTLYLPGIRRGGEWTDPIIHLCFAALSILAGSRWRNKSLPKANRVDRSGFLSIPTPRFRRRWLAQHLERIYADYKLRRASPDESEPTPEPGAPAPPEGVRR
jgi:FkbM family methyltransferase